MTWILASVVHSPLVEGVVLGITLKGAFLNYEAHLGVNYLVWHLILLLPRSLANSSFLLPSFQFLVKTWKVHISAAAVVADGLISNFSPPLCLLIIPICHD